MNKFDRDRPTKKVRMYPGHTPGLPHEPAPNGGFSRDETTLRVDSEAILESRNALPPSPPMAPRGRSMGPKSPAPESAILRVPRPRTTN